MIHPTAIVAPGAELGSDVAVGPYAVIEEHVTLEDGCRVGPHAHLSGHTRIGAGTQIHTGAVVGGVPQDVNYTGGESYTVVGPKSIIREYVTIHRGTDPGSTTEIGGGVMLMAMCHVGHNCCLGDNVVIANATLLAGHVQLGERAFLSGNVMVHQFVRIGPVAMIHAGEPVSQDVPPYCMLAERRIRGPNTIGLRRAGMDPDTRTAIRGAIKAYYGEGLNRHNALKKIQEEHGDVPEVAVFCEFIATTERGVMPGRLRPAGGKGARG